MGLCEPCMVIQRRASRPLLRPLIHRAGLRADILTGGLIHAGDQIAAAQSAGPGGGASRAADARVATGCHCRRSGAARRESGPGGALPAVPGVCPALVNDGVKGNWCWQALTTEGRGR
jgi:hypothetical protein